MATKDWKYTKVDKWRDLWTKGDERFGDFIHVNKTSLVGEWEVGARRKINFKTQNGHFRFFKSKAKSSKVCYGL